MSEIFDALRKAQRDVDARRTQGSERSKRDRDGDGAAPAASLHAIGHPSPARSAPAPPRGTFRWLRSWRGAASRNGSGRPQSSLLIGPHPGSETGEQFRVLRTRVETAGRGTFMITSALDQEGKSLCAVNLAVALSMSIGAGVILVDADLRHPSIERAFKLSRGPGLVDCLLGEATWNECLQSEREGLKVLPAGRRSVMSSELLGSERMLTLVADLKSHFPGHHVLVDAPPLLLTADPLVLARHMDHVLLVVRAGVTPRDAVLKAIETLGAERFLGIVFNDVAESASHYYYYGRYPYAGTESTG